MAHAQPADPQERQRAAGNWRATPTGSCWPSRPPSAPPSSGATAPLRWLPPTRCNEPRLLVLHARSRGALAAASCLAGTALTLSALEPWLVAQWHYGEMVRLPLSFFGAIFGAMVAAIALAGTLPSP